MQVFPKSLLVLLLALLIMPTSRAIAGGNNSRLPILAWMGPPAEQTSIERYKELANAGFTYSYSRFPNAKAQKAALDIAAKAGIKLFIQLPELRSQPKATAMRFKDHPGLGGYFLVDEPNTRTFADLSNWVRLIQSVDNVHPCYINLLPNYATAHQMGAPTYPDYVNHFLSQVPVQIISFDFYPLVNHSVRPDWYANLELIASESRRLNKPFWAFVLATAHARHPIPTLAQLRLQVFSDLAYGAQGIEYFTYWTPSPAIPLHFHDGPVSNSGKRTPTYENVKKVNGEISALSNIFSGSRVLSVRHTGPTIPLGTKRFQPTPPIRSVTTEGTGAVISMLANGNHRFLVVVNRDFMEPMPLAIRFDKGLSVIRVNSDGVRNQLSENSVQGNVDPGDLAIFAWEVHP